MLHTILLILAAVCLLLAAAGVHPGRTHMGWLGLLLLLIAGLT